MGEIADMMLDQMLYDDIWGDYDEREYFPSDLPHGVARPEMPVVKPTDFKDCTNVNS